MGLLSELKDVGSTAKKVGKKTLDVVEAGGLGWQRRVVQPVAYEAVQAKRDPIGFLRGKYRAPGFFGTERREEEERVLHELPLSIRIPLYLAADPTTYIGAGAAYKGVSAAALKGLAEGGIKGAIRLGTPAAAKEIVGLSGIGTLTDIASLPVRIPYNLARGNKLHTLLSLDRLIEDTKIEASVLGKELTNGQVDFLDRQGLVARTKIHEMLRNPKTVNFGELRETLGEWAKIRSKLTGQVIEDADVFNQIRRGRLNTIIGTVTRPMLEWEFSVRNLINEPNAFEIAVSKVPLLDRIQSILQPVVRAKLGDGILASVISFNVTERQLRERAQFMGQAISYAAHGAGMRFAADGTVLANGKSIGFFEDVYRNWRELRKAGVLTAEQAQVIEDFHLANTKFSLLIKAHLKEAGVSLDADWMQMLGEAEKRGGFFVPRVRKYIAKEAGLSISDALDAENLIQRASRKGRFLPKSVRERPPSGFRKVSAVKFRPGATQSTQMERQHEAAIDSARLIFASDPGEIFTGHAEQLAERFAWDAVAGPILKKKGLTPAQIHGVSLNQQGAFIAVKGKATGSVAAMTNRIIRSGTTDARDLAIVKKWQNSPYLTPDTKATLAELRVAIEDFLSSGPFRPTKAAERGQLRNVQAVENRILRASPKEQLTAQPSDVVLGREVAQPEKTTQIVPAKSRWDERFEQLGKFTKPTDEEKDLIGRELRPGLGTDEPEITDAQWDDLFNERWNEWKNRAKKEFPGPTKFTPAKGRDLRTAANRAARGQEGAYEFADEAARQAEIARWALTGRARAAHEAILTDIKAIREAAAQNKAAKKAVLEAKTMGGAWRQVQNIPGLSGRYFEEEAAKAIEKAWGVGDDLGTTGTVATVANAALQSIQAGFDLSYAFIQNMAVLATNPTGWGKALAYSIGGALNEGVYWRYMEGLGKSIDVKSGRSWMEIAEKARLSMSATELFRPAELFNAVGVSRTPLARALSFMEYLPWNRAWAMGRNMGAIEMLRSQVTLEQFMMGRALTDDELVSIGRGVDAATGVADYNKLGIGSTQGAVERVFVRFGAQWFRSQAGRLAQAVNMGMDGRVARRMLANQLGAMTMLYVSAAHLNGQTPELDPFNADGTFNTSFLTLSHGKQKYGFSTPYRAMMKLMIDVHQAVVSGNAEKLVNLRYAKNQSPFLQFWRSGSPTLAGLGADMVMEATGRADFPTVFDDPTQGFKLITPFSLQGAIEGTPEGTALPASEFGKSYIFQSFGFNASPIYPTERWREATMNTARELGFRDWVDIPEAQQKEIIRGSKELQEIQAAKEAYASRFKGSKEDWAYEQVNNAAKVMELAVVSDWQRVQDGTLSKADFRRNFSEQNARRANIADQLLTDIPQKEKATLQDRLAAAYSRITPELYGIDAASTDAERNLAFSNWRKARQQFWDEHPEAEQYREYITVDYPARNWKSPEMVEAATERAQAQVAYNSLLQIPKYRGLSLEDGEFVDLIRGIADQARQQIDIELAKRGKFNARISNRMAWKFALQQLKGVAVTEQEIPLIRLAMAMDMNPRVKMKLLSPARINALLNNPSLMEWYPQSYRDAGLNDEQAARLGLIQASFASAPAETFQQARGLAYGTAPPPPPLPYAS